MNEFEKALSEFLSKDKSNPVSVQIETVTRDKMPNGMEPAEALVTIRVRDLVSLIRTKTQLDVLREAYRNMEHYETEKVLRAVFGPRHTEGKNAE